MLDWMKTRRSIRKYQDRQIEQEKLDAILKGGLMAPSSRGRKPWNSSLWMIKKRFRNYHIARKYIRIHVRSSLAIVVAANGEIGDIWVEDASIAASYMQLDPFIGSGLLLDSCAGKVSQ